MDPYPLPVWEEVYYSFGPVGGWIVDGYTVTYRGQVDVVRRYPDVTASLHPIVLHQPLQISFPVPEAHFLKINQPPAYPPSIPLTGPPTTALRTTARKRVGNARNYRNLFTSTSTGLSNGFLSHSSTDDDTSSEDDPMEDPVFPPGSPSLF